MTLISKVVPFQEKSRYQICHPRRLSTSRKPCLSRLSPNPPISFSSLELLRLIVTLWNPLARDCQQGRFPKVMVTGLSGRLYSETGKPVAHIMRDELITRGIPSDVILVQDKSTNTLEDVAFSLDVLEKHDISPESIAFLCKAHHSGRCLRTLRKFFPSQTLSPVTYLAEYEGIKISKEDWYQHEVSRGRVYGEYLRIIEYTRRGDIADL